MKNIIISLAPAGGWGRGRNNPVSAAEIADEVLACAESGAALVHLHSRDREGLLSGTTDNFDAAVDLIRKKSDIIIEGSTGGLSGLSAAERINPVRNKYVRLGSLNLGSLNFGDNVYKNSMPDVKYWAAEMEKQSVKPSLEIFDTGHLEAALSLLDEGIINYPANFSFIFGVRWGMKYSEELLSYLIKRLPSDSRWGIINVDSIDFTRHIKAAQLGASFVRTGFEDTCFYNGKTAASNKELIAALSEELFKNGFKAAAVEEAKQILNIN